MKADVIKDVSLLFPTIGMDSATPDRVVAIICAAYADKYLSLQLRDSFVGANHALKEKLFKPEGLLGAFSAKIDIAKAIGIIGPTTSNDLILVARIRNRFAHYLEIESFDDEQISKLVSQFKAEQCHSAQIPSVMKDAHNEMIAGMTSRQKFAYNASSVCLALSDRYDPTSNQNIEHRTEG